MVDVFDLSNSDPFRTKTRFDADKFKGLKAKVKLCWVPWDQNWTNVIDWKSDDQRNSYFDNLEGHVLDEETGWNYRNLEVWKAGLGKHAGDIQVPLPYAEAIQFNYVWVELYEVPVPGGDIERREHYGYFLSGLESKAASTTLLALELDTWTTYWPSMSIGGINLRRGHYFHAKTSAAAFLENPLENSLGLIEPEPDLPILQPKVAHSELVSFQKSEPRICIATTGDFTDRRSWFTVIPRDVEDEPDARAVAFPAATTPGSMNTPWNRPFDAPRGDYNTTETVGHKASVKQMSNGQGSPETLNVYSMTPTDYLTFVAYARQDMVQILDSVKGVYVLDSALITEGASFTQWGFTFKPVRQSADPKLIKSFKPSQDMFAYPDIAKDFAKLYTTQFARIEISNLQGQKAEISVEDIAETLDVYARSSSLFPFLKLEALLDGVGGRGIKKYAVRPLGNLEASSFGGRWEDYKFDLDIPLFGITVAKDQDVAQHEIARREQDARVAKVNELYAKGRADENWLADRGTISADLTNAVAEYENTRYNDTDRTNTAFSNAIKAATNERDTSLATTLKDYNNTSASIDNTYDNAQLENLKTMANAQRSASTARANALINVYTIEANGPLEASTARDNTRDTLQMSYDRWFNYARFVEEVKIHGVAPGWNSNEKVEWAKGGVLPNMRNRYDSVWASKLSLFNLMIDAATATAGMGLLTSAKVSAYGTVGSGVSSLPGPSINSSYEGGGTTVGEGGASIGTGAFAGLAAMNPVNMAFTLAINEAIWELQVKQVNIQYSSYADETMELKGTSFTYRGRGTKRAEYDHNSFVSGWEIDMNIWEVDRNFGADRLLNDDLETRKLSTGTAVADRSYHTSIVVNQNNAGAIGNASKNNLEKDQANYTADYDTRLTVIGNDRSVSRFVQQADFDRANLNTGANFDTSSEIALANRTLGYTLLERNYALKNATVPRSMRARFNRIDTTLQLDRLGADVDLGKANGAWSSEFLRSVQGEPGQYGESSGKAWIDQWGLRGLEVRVLRCTDAIAEQAASTFMLYGYRTPGLFVRNPKISTMTAFTYWEGDGVWLQGDLINESNKQLIRKIFERGVTVWSDPTLIFNVDITANRPAEEEA